MMSGAMVMYLRTRPVYAATNRIHEHTMSAVNHFQFVLYIGFVFVTVDASDTTNSASEAGVAPLSIPVSTTESGKLPAREGVPYVDCQ